MTHSRLIALVVAVVVLAGTVAAQETEPRVNPKKQAKVYESTLQGLMGQPFGKVISTVEGWKFEAVVAWDADNPDAKEVASHNRGKIKFSGQETAAIFGRGAFKVRVYRKLVSTDRTTVGEVNEFGMTVGKDYAVDVNRYAVIRVVFKDGVLHHCRVWPSMEQSGISGGVTYRRGGTIR